MTKDELIKKSTEIYGADKYAFDKTVIKHMKDKVTITCSKHGDFEQDLSHFIYRKQGCPQCSKKTRYTRESFIEKCIEKRGIEENIDYSKTVYAGYNTKATFVCKKHGDFTMTPGHFLSGEGCPLCRYEKVADKEKGNIAEYLEKAKLLHKNKYDYSLVNPSKYKNYRTILPIICHEKDKNGNEHGVFYQTLGNHINKTHAQGCPICGKNANTLARTRSYDDVIQSCMEIHGGKYSYVNDLEYINTNSKLHIVCPEHGIFSQKASNHLSGQGCPFCFKSKSKIEQEIIDFVREIYHGSVVENDREILEGKEIDILLPEKHIGFEVDGLIWHSEKFQENKNDSVEKTNLGESKGFQICHIFEDEWNNHIEICKSRIKNLLGLTDNKIYARKCEIVEVSYDDTCKFLTLNHIQGNVNSTTRYGLKYNGELVSIMTFGSLRKNLGQTKKEGSFEMLRFCNKLNTTVVGGASRLLKHFIKTNHPKEIVSYADRRWSVGHLYENLGFEFIENTRPNYFYIVNKMRKNRYNYRKDILVSKYGCPPDKTEHDFCLEQGWYRIYDCGNKKYVLRFNGEENNV